MPEKWLRWHHAAVVQIAGESYGGACSTPSLRTGGRKLTVADIRPFFHMAFKPGTRAAPFKAGQPSANPRGRPKSDKKIIKAARVHTEEALLGLVNIASDARIRPLHRIMACKKLLVRGSCKSIKNMRFFARVASVSLGISIALTLSLSA